MPRKPDPFWFSPTPDAVRNVVELEDIMWGGAGRPRYEESVDSATAQECVASANASGNEEKPPPIAARGRTSSTSSSYVDLEGGAKFACVAWKKRSGLGRYSRGYVKNAWERRRVVVKGTRLLYYRAQGDDEELEDTILAGPRGTLDLAEGDCRIELVDPVSSDAPTPYEADIVCEADDVRWRFCLESEEVMSQLFDAVSAEGAGELIAVDAEYGGDFGHKFEAGDHIYRWEMIIFPPVIYPVQIHGICLEVGKNCVIVADFGMTGYGKKEGSSFNHSEDHNADDIQETMMAAWKKFRPKEEQRLNLLTITDPKEIRKWSKANYESQSEKTPKKKYMGKLSKMFSSSQQRARPRNIGDAERIMTRSSAQVGSSSTREHPPRKGLDPTLTPRDQTPSDADIPDDAPDWFSESNAPKAAGPSVFSVGDAKSELPKSDPTKIVLARANLLLEYGEKVLPPYHVFYSNSECIAVWCKTGRWSTLQAIVYLTTTSVGGAKTSALSVISLAAAHAVLAPVAAVGGIIWVGAPMMILKKSAEKWQAYTTMMNDLFWSWAPPDVFVCAIENWSRIDGNGEDDEEGGDFQPTLATSR